MHRPDFASQTARFPQGAANGWLARRWYYTPRTHRAYSVRQISPGDRRLLAEFALALNDGTSDRGLHELRELSDMLFDRVIAGGCDTSVGFAALESAGAGDRIIGVAAYAPCGDEHATFSTAVARTHREEQVGRTLLATLLRHAKRVGVRRLVGHMNLANRPMQMLAMSMGFNIEQPPHDGALRRLVMALK
jgi:GNAT superfamily N-acetyltransferase